jgi:hypothetical protein
VAKAFTESVTATLTMPAPVSEAFFHLLGVLLTAIFLLGRGFLGERKRAHRKNH